MSIETDENKIPYILLGEGYRIRLEFEDLADEKYIAKAKNELRETPEIAKAAIDELRELITGEWEANNENKLQAKHRSTTKRTKFWYSDHHFLYRIGSVSVHDTLHCADKTTFKEQQPQNEIKASTACDWIVCKCAVNTLMAVAHFMVERATQFNWSAWHWNWKLK